ncbi:DUF2218 domain-containing protein [Streptomyces griseorubiginosus]|uniref:DUF2218 domain-containing protein n=1 Tax=Streptomyces griseorubiginosus TaxID=67304 RepID=UPI002E810061|nr:DUF2218 domain-containing protein [Streptomyces griseorubiginosus]WUB42953.1 DUF2218 domain-containing protein [Streptomyces griseorubiginosus]WUB51471.1 DUF2218 domain-containing protein [Streptomyces griseorubiginosus]
MPRSEARVATDRPHRYAKQLAAHLGRRLQTSWDEDSGEGTLLFPNGGKGSLTAAEGALLLTLETESENLDLLETAVGSHLVRFGSKLVVEWTRDGGAPGTTQRKETD